MHILITDSGVGGLSVCAYAERFLRTRGSPEPVRLTYVNASPENDFGYNSMGSRQEKLDHFDRFLHIVTDTYAPDLIYVACNTLSVLLPGTRFSRKARVPTLGIVETGVNRLLRDLDRFPDGAVAIFGTATTIDERTYPKMLQERGVLEERIISQACPGLADTISEDRSGSQAGAEIATFVREALARPEASAGVRLAYLACTHYGYRKELFAAAFEAAGLQTEVLDPNEFAVEDLFARTAGGLIGHDGCHEVSVEFVTRYRIPETALETITFFLEGISPRTVRAFQEYTHVPELF